MPLGDGSFGLLPEEWLKKYVTLAGVGTPEGDHLRFRRTQVGLLDVLLAEQPERDSTSDSSGRERLRQFQGMRPRTRRPGSRVSSAAIAATASAGSTSSGSSVSAAAWPTTWAWARPSRCTRPAGGRAASCGPPPGNAAAPAVAGRGAAVARLQLEAGGRFTPKLRVLDHTGIGRGKPGNNSTTATSS